MHNQFKPGDWSELKRLAEAAVEARPDRQYPTFGYAKAMSQLHEKASPEAILALIAENERLQEEAGSGRAHGRALRQIGSALGIPAGSNLHTDCVPKIYSLFTSIGRTTAEAAQAHVRFSAERDQLRAEVEALRKDAERYRWLRSAENDVAITFGIHAWEDLSDEFMDAAIDAAMGNDAGGHSTENQDETRENTGREAGGQGEVR